MKSFSRLLAAFFLTATLGLGVVACSPSTDDSGDNQQTSAPENSTDPASQTQEGADGGQGDVRGQNAADEQATEEASGNN